MGCGRAGAGQIGCSWFLKNHVLGGLVRAGLTFSLNPRPDLTRRCPACGVV